jgi:hypothetical protein
MTTLKSYALVEDCWPLPWVSTLQDILDDFVAKYDFDPGELPPQLSENSLGSEWNKLCLIKKKKKVRTTHESFPISSMFTQSDSFKFTIGVQLLAAGCRYAGVKLRWLGMVRWQVVPACLHKVSRRTSNHSNHWNWHQRSDWGFATFLVMIPTLPFPRARCCSTQKSSALALWSPVPVTWTWHAAACWYLVCR